MTNFGRGENCSIKMIRGRFIRSKQRSLRLKRVRKVKNTLEDKLPNNVYRNRLCAPTTRQFMTRTWSSIDFSPNCPSQYLSLSYSIIPSYLPRPIKPPLEVYNSLAIFFIFQYPIYGPRTMACKSNDNS